MHGRVMHHAAFCFQVLCVGLCAASYKDTFSAPAAPPYAYLDLDEPNFAAASSAEVCQGLQASWCIGCQ